MQGGSWQSTPDSRSDQSDETESSSSEGRPVKMSQRSLWFVEISLEIHASVSLQGMQYHKLALLALELTQALVCSLFISSHSLDCISCAVKKCVILLLEPLGYHQPRLKWFWRSWCIQGAERGMVTNVYETRNICSEFNLVSGEGLELVKSWIFTKKNRWKSIENLYWSSYTLLRCHHLFI